MQNRESTAMSWIILGWVVYWQLTSYNKGNSCSRPAGLPVHWIGAWREWFLFVITATLKWKLGPNPASAQTVESWIVSVTLLRLRGGHFKHENRKMSGIIWNLYWQAEAKYIESMSDYLRSWTLFVSVFSSPKLGLSMRNHHCSKALCRNEFEAVYPRCPTIRMISPTVWLIWSSLDICGVPSPSCGP